MSSTSLVNSLKSLAMSGARNETAKLRSMQYINALVVATQLMEAISRKPGFNNLVGKNPKPVLDEIMNNMIAVIENFTERAVKNGYGFVYDEPKNKATLIRLSAEMVADFWDKDPQDMINKAARYADYLARYMSGIHVNSDEADESDLLDKSRPEYMDNLIVDRMIALHTAYQTINQAVSNNYRVISHPYILSVMFGDDDKNIDPMKITSVIINDIVIPTVESRMESMFTHIHDQAPVTDRDRHIAMRSFLRAVSKDCALIVQYEIEGAISYLKDLSKEDRDKYRGQDGFFKGFLQYRLDYRLDVFYPNPEHFSKPSKDGELEKKTAAGAGSDKKPKG
jgi:hypothetical protein